MMLNNLTDLLVHEIQDLHSAETQLLDALPKMAAAANNEDLRAAFRDHLTETSGHVDRLVEAAERLGVAPTGETCEAMKGLIREGEKTINTMADPVVKDAALIAVAQRVEHYEIAAYGSAACFAEVTGEKEVKKLLGETLDEEKAADKKLNSIATGGMFSSGLNKEAPST